MNGHLGEPWFSFKSKAFRFGPDDGAGGSAAAVATPAVGAPSEVPPIPVAAPTVPEGGDQPRDEKGRFTPQRIAEAAGLKWEPTTAQTTPPDGTTATALPTAEPTAATTPAAPADAGAAIEAFLNTPIPTAESALGGIPTPAAQPVPAPQQYQTPEAAQAAAWAQNPDAAREAIGYVQQAAQLNQALERGDVSGALGMFAPGALQLITEHIYRQNADAFAQRYANEAAGQGAPDPRIDMLQRQLADLRNSQLSRDQQEQQQRQQYQQQQQSLQFRQKLAAHVDGLFAQIPQIKEHRDWIEARVFTELRKDPNAATMIRQGQFGPLSLKFREVLKQFRPYLGAAAASPQAATATPGSTQLMTQPSGSTTAAAPVADSGIVDGRLTAGFFKAQAARLKKLVG